MNGFSGFHAYMIVLWPARKTQASGTGDREWFLDGWFWGAGLQLLLRLSGGVGFDAIFGKS